MPTGRYIWGPATASLWSTPQRAFWSTAATVLELALLVVLVLMDRLWLLLPVAIVWWIGTWLLGRELSLRDALRSELEDDVRGVDGVS